MVTKLAVDPPFPTTSAAECLGRCKEIETCGGYVWHMQSLQCILAEEIEGEPYEDENLTTGPKDCLGISNEIIFHCRVLQFAVSLFFRDNGGGSCVLTQLKPYFRKTKKLRP